MSVQSTLSSPSRALAAWSPHAKLKWLHYLSLVPFMLWVTELPLKKKKKSKWLHATLGLYFLSEPAFCRDFFVADCFGLVWLDLRIVFHSTQWFLASSFFIISPKHKSSYIIAGYLLLYLDSSIWASAQDKLVYWWYYLYTPFHGTFLLPEFRWCVYSYNSDFFLTVALLCISNVSILLEICDGNITL